MISINQVYDTLEKALDGVYVTKYYNRIPEQLPCVYFRESHNPVFKYIQFDRNDEQIRLVCYVEVFGYDIDSIVATVEQTFKQMYFIEELAEMVPNYDPSVERMSMRFQRIIAGGDTLGNEDQGDNQGADQGSETP